jgi:DNA-binding HxlR family transcriptional regulator
MGTYRQYCPIARASEILAERWTPLVVRNLMFGADTFTAIARGVPTMSRSMLVKRLDELERAGILARTPKPGGQGHRYGLTPAGLALAGVINSLAEWGEEYIDVTTEQSDPAFALWAWCQVQLDRERLPSERTIVAFTFPDQPPTNRCYWLLVERGDAELCYADPGGDPDVAVRASSTAFVDWHRGVSEWGQLVDAGQIEVTGPSRLVLDLPTWNLRRPVLSPAVAEVRAGSGAR